MWPFTKSSLKPKRPKMRAVKPDHQHIIGGVWGNHMRFFDTEPRADGSFRLWGHKLRDDFPCVGQIVKAEFRRSWVWLEITNVDWQSEPSDMYFLNAYPVFQEMKAIPRQTPQNIPSSTNAGRPYPLVWLPTMLKKKRK